MDGAELAAHVTVVGHPAHSVNQVHTIRAALLREINCVPPLARFSARVDTALHDEWHPGEYNCDTDDDEWQQRYSGEFD